MFPLKLKVEFLGGSQWNWKLNFSKVPSGIESWISQMFPLKLSWISQRFSTEIESWIFQRFLSDLDYTLHGIVYLQFVNDVYVSHRFVLRGRVWFTVKDFTALGSWNWKSVSWTFCFDQDASLCGYCTLRLHQPQFWLTVEVTIVSELKLKVEFFKCFCLIKMILCVVIGHLN